MLIDTTTLTLQYVPRSDEAYAILSHTWGSAAEEVTYQEMVAPTRSESTLSKPGYHKIVQTCEIARTQYQLRWAWIDTCCIDKSSSAELSEAINSMFRWYRDAFVCFAYLADMDENPTSFQRSRWFTRGWTLQELIAPGDLVFFDGDWNFRGTKSSMGSQISFATGIPAGVLENSIMLHDIPVAVRLSWASKRETTRDEDLAYCLLGIFDVNIPMLYGEGTKAFMRLQEAILSQSADMSLFLWTDRLLAQQYTGLFAYAPSCFQQMSCANAEPTFTQPEFYPTNRGIRMKLGITWDSATGLAILPLEHSMTYDEKPLGIYLRRFGSDLFVRAQPQEYCSVSTEREYTVFTAAKSLTRSQSKAIESNVLRISVPGDINPIRGEPLGSWDPANSLIYAGYTGASQGYLTFGKPGYDPFALVYCFRSGNWSATVVTGRRCEKIHIDFYKYFKEIFTELIPGSSTELAQIGYILASNMKENILALNMKENILALYMKESILDRNAKDAILVQFQGTAPSTPPYVLIQNVDFKGNRWERLRLLHKQY